MSNAPGIETQPVDNHYVGNCSEQINQLVGIYRFKGQKIHVSCLASGELEPDSKESGAFKYEFIFVWRKAEAVEKSLVRVSCEDKLKIDILGPCEV